MTALDIVVIAAILISAVVAYWRGFVHEALSVAAWVLAAVVAYYAYPYLLPLGERFLPKGAVADIATGAIIFVIALAILHIIAKMLSRRVKHSALSPLDRSFGFLFGLARGLVLVCIGYIAVAWFMPQSEPAPEWFAKARTRPYLAAGAEQLQSLFSHPGRGKSSGRNSVEREAEQAIGAFTKPSPKPGADSAPAYTPDEKRDLNRLIQQQSGH